MRPRYPSVARGSLLALTETALRKVRLLPLKSRAARPPLDRHAKCKNLPNSAEGFLDSMCLLGF